MATRETELQQDLNALLRAFSVIHKLCKTCDNCNHKEQAQQTIERLLNKHEGQITW